jgi:hypothetical protein
MQFSLACNTAASLRLRHERGVDPQRLCRQGVIEDAVRAGDDVYGTEVGRVPVKGRHAW